MIEDEKLGIKVAENTDEKFWAETKEQIETSDKAEARNAKVREVMLKLCNEELAEK